MLPRRKNNEPRPLRDAQLASDQADQARLLMDEAEKLMRNAQKLRDIEGDETGAQGLEEQANKLNTEAQDFAQQAQKNRASAARKATIISLVKAPFHAAGTYGRQYLETAAAIANPVNRLQNLFAVSTPFTSAFSREKSRLMGGAPDAEFGVPFEKIGKRLDETNSLLTLIARIQPRILKTQDETKGQVSLVDEASRENLNKQITVIKTLDDIKNILSKANGGYGSDFPDFGVPGEPGPDRPSGPMLPAPPQLKLLPDLRPPEQRESPVVKLLTDQRDILKAMLNIDQEQLDTAVETQETQRLIAARNADEQNVDVNSPLGLRGLGQDGEEGEGGGRRRPGLISTILSAVGGGLSRLLGPLLGGGAAILGGAGALFGGRALLNMGARGAGTAAVEGAARAAAPAAARGGAGILGRIFGGAGGRAAAGAATEVGAEALARGGALGASRLIPGIGNIVGAGMGAYGAWEQARRGNWGGAALNAVGGVVSLLPGVGQWAGLGIETAAQFVDTSGHPPTNDARAAQMRAAASAAQRQGGAANVVTNNYNTVNNTSAGGGNSGPVIAQVGKSIVQRSRDDLFAYVS